MNKLFNLLLLSKSILIKKNKKLTNEIALNQIDWKGTDNDLEMNKFVKIEIVFAVKITCCTNNKDKELLSLNYKKINFGIKTIKGNYFEIDHAQIELKNIAHDIRKEECELQNDYD